jgi:photosystem II stability/assembly factor-like uncharacterized protein
MPGSGVQLASARRGFSLLGEPTNGFDGNLSAPDGLILAWPSPSVLVTGDGARRWTRSLSVRGGFWGLDVLDPSHAWAVGVAGLYGTVDGGKHWERAGELPKALVRVAFGGPRRGFGLTLTGRLVKSDDSGSSWRGSVWHGRGEALCAPKPGVVVVADRSGGLWRSGNGDRSWRRVAAGIAHVEQLSDWYPDMSCQGSNAVQLAQAFCEAACGGEVDSRVRQTTDGGLDWQAILSQSAGAGGVHSDPASGPRVLIDRAAAVGSRGVCLVGSAYSGPATVAISCRTHAGEAYRTATVPRLPFPPSTHTGVAFQGLDFLNAKTGWLLLDEYTTAGTPTTSQAKTEIWSTHDGGRTWRATYVSPPYRGRWCSKLHTSTCWR